MPTSHTEPPGRSALALSAVVGACLAAVLGLATDQASAAYTARVQAGTLELTGDGASDKLALLAARRADDAPGRRRRGRHARLQLRPQHLHRDPTSRPAAATTRSASTRAAARSPTRPSRSTAAPATTR